MNSPRSITPLNTRYGSVGQGGEWQEAIEAYYWDRLPEAFEMAQALGAGFAGGSMVWYRRIEAEALSHENAILETLNDKLSLEYDPSDIDFGDEQRAAILHATQVVAKRLGWGFETDVRVAILIEAVFAQWDGARFGYCTDKYPFDKICIPRNAAVHPETLVPVMAHEFTHVITLNLTQGRIPHWLDEGLAQLMEGSAPPLRGEWMDPIALNAAFEGDRRDQDGMSHASAGYAQAACLVRELYKMGGDANLAKLLRAFTNNTFWTEMKINLMGDTSIKEALHEVYGLDEHSWFEIGRANAS